MSGGVASAHVADSPSSSSSSHAAPAPALLGPAGQRRLAAVVAFGTKGISLER